MRFSIITLSTALLATLASAHTVDCGGKALSAPIHGLIDSLHVLRMIVDGEFAPEYEKRRYLKPNLCEEVSCFEGTQIRWCNEDPDYGRAMDLVHIVEGASVLYAECQEVYKGEWVAGGVLYHPDKWTVIVQQEDECHLGLSK